MDEKETQEKVQNETQGQKQEEATEEGKSMQTPVESTPKEDGTQKSPLEEARELDKSIDKKLDKYGAMVERHEKLLAEARIEGRSFAGQQTKPQYTKEQTEARKRIKAIGDATGANWAKGMEEKLE